MKASKNVKRDFPKLVLGETSFYFGILCEDTLKCGALFAMNYVLTAVRFSLIRAFLPVRARR